MSAMGKYNALLEQQASAVRTLGFESIYAAMRWMDGLSADAVTVADLKRALAVISTCAFDPERAHGMEDDLRELVLRAVATGRSDGPELANLALSSSEIKFARWCA